MLFRSACLLPIQGPPIFDGALRVRGNRITEIGLASELIPEADEEIWEGDHHVLLPGLINGHAHLELHHLRGALRPGCGFADWVNAMRAKTRDWTEADYVDGSRLGALECLRHGTTTVVDISNTASTCAAAADLPLRIFLGLEVIGLDPALAESRLEAARNRLAVTPAGKLLTKGLTPHSAYSVSRSLFQGIRKHAGEVPFTLHVGESLEEEDLFASASGPLQEFCQAVYPHAPQYRGLTPLKYLRERNMLPSRPLIVHANGRSREEADYLATLQATVVHCPQSHAFFGHPAFPARQYRDTGIPLALGTDSLASGQSLSLWEAMRTFHQHFPDWPAEEILAMTTYHPGLALYPDGRLGRLAPGTLADFIAVPLALKRDGHPAQALIEEAQDIHLVVVDGTPVLI